MLTFYLVIKINAKNAEYLIFEFKYEIQSTNAHT